MVHVHDRRLASDLIKSMEWEHGGAAIALEIAKIDYARIKVRVGTDFRNNWLNNIITYLSMLLIWYG